MALQEQENLFNLISGAVEKGYLEAKVEIAKVQSSKGQERGEQMAKNYNISATLEVINKFTKPVQQFKEQIRSVSKPVNQAKQSIKGIERTTQQSVNNASNSLNKLVGKFKTLATTIGAGFGLSKLINTSDTMTNLHNL